MTADMNGGRAEGTVRRRVTIRSGNRFTAAEVMRVLETIPPEARMNAKSMVGEDPEVNFWWDEVVS